MGTEKEPTIPPGIVRRLKTAKSTFLLHLGILTLLLVMMALLLFISGPAGFARSMVAFSVYLVLYLIFSFKIYGDWQKEKNFLLDRKKSSSKAPGLISTPVTNPSTAPTSPIDTKERDKLRSGQCKTSERSSSSS